MLCIGCGHLEDLNIDINIRDYYERKETWGE